MCNYYDTEKGVSISLGDTTFTKVDDEFLKFYNEQKKSSSGVSAMVPDDNVPMGVFEDVLDRLSGKTVQKFRDSEEKKYPSIIKKDSLMVIMINPAGHIAVDIPKDKNTYVENNIEKLKDAVKKYIKNIGGYVFIRYDRATKFDDYMVVENAVTKTYYDLRNEYAQEHFGKKMDKLDGDQKKAVEKALPYKIARGCRQN